MNFVDENHAGNNLCYALVNITFNNLLDFPTKLIGYFCSPSFYEAAHDRHDVLPALWTCVGRIEVAEGNVLNHFFFL